MKKQWYEVIGLLKQGRRVRSFIATQKDTSEVLVRKHIAEAFPDVEIQSISLLEKDVGTPN